MFSKVRVAVVLGYFASSMTAFADAYETHEFRNPDSRIPTMMLCSFAGEHTGQDPNATELMVEFFAAMGASNTKIEAWGRDTITYATTEMSGINLEAFWRDSCSEQFKNMRNALG